MRRAEDRPSVADPGLGQRDSRLPPRGPEWDDVRRAGGAGRQPEEAFHLYSAIEPLALDALTIASQDTAAHVGVKRRRLHAEQARGLLDRQVLLAVHADHKPQARLGRQGPSPATACSTHIVSPSEASRPGRSRPDWGWR